MIWKEDVFNFRLGRREDRWSLTAQEMCEDLLVKRPLRVSVVTKLKMAPLSQCNSKIIIHLINVCPSALGGGAVTFCLPTDRHKVESFLRAIFSNTSADRISALFPQHFHKYTLNACQRLHSDRTQGRLFYSRKTRIFQREIN